MPIHDWKPVYPGLFHHFHLGWVCAISNQLNGGGLPPGFSALLTLAEPRSRFQSRSEVDGYAARANQIAVHYPLGNVVAIIEIVSPGNKSSPTNLKEFVDMTFSFIENGIHVLVIDLLPPSKSDLQGIHKLIWDEFVDEPFELPSAKPLTVVSYSASEIKTAYVEPVAVGQVLPDMPLFLGGDRYVSVSLESTYQKSWNDCPEPLQQAVLGTLDHE